MDSLEITFTKTKAEIAWWQQALAGCTMTSFFALAVWSVLHYPYGVAWVWALVGGSWVLQQKGWLRVFHIQEGDRWSERFAKVVVNHVVKTLAALVFALGCGLVVPFLFPAIGAGVGLYLGVKLFSIRSK